MPQRNLAPRQRHRRCLKQNHRVRHRNLLTSGKLTGDPADLDGQAEKMCSHLVKQLEGQQGVPKQLAAENQMT